MLDRWLPETGFGFVLIGIIFLIGLVVIAILATIRSYRHQHAVDHVLLDLLGLEKPEFFKKLEELGFFFSRRLYLVGKMGTGIASKKVVTKILHQYLVFQPNQTDEVVFSALEHFEQRKPFFLRLRWFDSPKWEWSQTRDLISKIHSLFSPEDDDEIATRYDLLRALDQHLRAENVGWQKSKLAKKENAVKNRQDEYWQLAKKILHKPELPELTVINPKEIPASADTLP
jgi:hypothetical protein